MVQLRTEGFNAIPALSQAEKDKSAKLGNYLTLAVLKTLPEKQKREAEKHALQIKKDEMQLENQVLNYALKSINMLDPNDPEDYVALRQHLTKDLGVQESVLPEGFQDQSGQWSADEFNNYRNQLVMEGKDRIAQNLAELRRKPKEGDTIDYAETDPGTGEASMVTEVYKNGKWIVKRLPLDQYLQAKSKAKGKTGGGMKSSDSNSIAKAIEGLYDITFIINPDGTQTYKIGGSDAERKEALSIISRAEEIFMKGNVGHRQAAEQAAREMGIEFPEKQKQEWKSYLPQGGAQGTIPTETIPAHNRLKP